MQSVEGPNNNLECADCKRTFTSASLLLKHFAEHINQVETDNLQKHVSELSLPRNSVLPLFQTKKKVRKSILEAVLRQSAFHCKIDDTDLAPVNFIYETVCNSNTSSSSDSFKSSSNTKVTKCDEDVTTVLPNMVIEIGQRAKEKLKCSSDTSVMKFDLQKRLEKCVSKLQAQKHSKEGTSVSNEAHNSLSEAEAELFNTNQEKEVSKRRDRRELSPMTFCVVTLQEDENQMVLEKTAVRGDSRVVKGASNRKQLMPKKIQRPVEDIKTEVMKSEVLSLSGIKPGQKASTKRKYLCHVCSKSFGWSTDLKRHILTHTGERPFKCQMCDATFTRNFLLQKHESRVHSLDNMDSKYTREEDKESSQPVGNNNNNNNNCVKIELDVGSIGVEKLVTARKNTPKKVFRSNKMSNAFRKKSRVLNSAEIKDSCDKFSPTKRKLQREESSFDHFPHKVFNIL